MSQLSQLQLPQGNITVIDSAYLSLVQVCSWYLGKNGYVQNRVHGYMHRYIWIQVYGPIPDGYEIDHINNDRLDNRLYNLRLATVAQNRRNRKKTIGTSKYKGVCWDRNRRKWLASITMHNKQLYLGRFDSELDAAKAYDKAARELFGEFAKTNSDT